MTKYYIKPDKNNEFPDKGIAPVLEVADGLIEVDIPATSVEYFTRYWWMYRLQDNGQVQAPGNLPDTTIDYLQSLIDQQSQQINAQNTQINTLVSTTQDLQTVSGKLGGQLAQALASNAAAQQTIKDLQTTAGKLGGQVAQLLADKTASK
ncbi:hypothetical protein [Lentilactobacillus buchneri]|uniref:hypothetical protein n=1 Tax=Lentilactobacillus buchneri TaxID=1581 RepID=UPI001290A4FD|nr:hypothetical protein [Lentilactobacillus buchneri]MQM78814.1 hypothetical protein [Lentilactobacillus buchneri]MQM88868.1 hypothetical protein [Lentilactobacillus buchneri]MQN21017.1 hypothetical protein [Lentilactobacillus buchneri]